MDQKREHSSLKISNIQSLQQDVKLEKETNEEQSTIKIRTISEINQTGVPLINTIRNVTISKQHPQQILSKQIVVKKVPSSNSVLIKRTNGTAKIVKNQQQNDLQTKPSSFNFTIPPALESYIKELEDQNREMKKVLMECRREAISVQMRTHKLTNLINATTSKCNAKRPVITMKPIPNQSHQLPSNQSVQELVSLKKTFRFVPKKNNITAKGNIVCRVPIFPITRLHILKQLELDLSKKEFSEYVFQKLYTVNNKSDIDKPSILLNNTLNSIIDPKLMGQFKYEESSELNDKNECEYFKSLQRVRVLYGKLVNALSNTIFTKSVDMVALEKFVINKISSHRNDYLVNLERLKASKTLKSMKIETSSMLIKTENACNKSINTIENQIKWIDEEDQPMNSEED